MMYSYDRGYVFDSSRFEKRFDIKARPKKKGSHRVLLNRDISHNAHVNLHSRVCNKIFPTACVLLSVLALLSARNIA
jgi:hypothetical protein